MNAQQNEAGTLSCRSILKEFATLLVGGAAGGAVGWYAAKAAASEVPSATTPLPWKWVKLDPLEAGRRAYQYYPIKGGCGSTTYLALLSLLKEKVGYPYTTLPDVIMMMIHAGSGYGGHGTLCGALGGTSLIINVVSATVELGLARRSR